jgi:hypothetical protein
MKKLSSPAASQLAYATLALAAGLAIGLWLRPGSNFATDAKGHLVASGELDRVLDRRLAWDQTATILPRIGISFRNKSGEICRTFSSAETAGYACHRGRVWAVDALVRHVSDGAGASYRMVGSDLPDILRGAVTDNMDGEPFDATDEVRARNNGWTGR